MRLSALFRSTVVRIAAVLLAVQIVAVALALLTMTILTERVVDQSARAFVSELRSDIIAGLARGGPEQGRALVNSRLAMVADRDAVLLLVAPDGTRLAGNVDAWPPTVAAGSRWQAITLYRSNARQPEAMRVDAVGLPGNFRLLVGQVTEGEQRVTQASLTSFVTALLFGIALAGVGSWLCATLIASRIGGIASVAGRVSSGEIASRVARDGSNDAFDGLAARINEMLSRIDALVTELRLVTDALAHDLRSPVARLKSTVERALRSTTDADATAALVLVEREADRLLAMLTTALQISRTEAGIGRNQFQTFDLAAVLEDIGEVYGPVAEDRGFTLTVSVPPMLTVAAHRELLAQALGNLIDNALKYAEGGRRITLEAKGIDDDVGISVCDDGPGIANRDHDAALRRFGRLDPARSESGAGLGLSLVTTIAHLHGGTVLLSNASPGLCVRLLLPIRA